MDGDRANGEVNLYNNVTFTQFVTHSSFLRQPNDRPPPPIRPTDRPSDTLEIFSRTDIFVLWPQGVNMA